MVISDNGNDNDDVGDDVDDGVKGSGRELHAYNNHYEPQMLGPPDMYNMYIERHDNHERKRASERE